LGDIDDDKKVSGNDVASVSWSFGAYGPDYFYPGSPPHPRWNSTKDMDGDNKISGTDVAIVSRQFGKGCY
jgi:hypothetical protein